VENGKRKIGRRGSVKLKERKRNSRRKGVHDEAEDGENEQQS
jgi:hypothetical protein